MRALVDVAIRCDGDDEDLSRLLRLLKMSNVADVQEVEDPVTLHNGSPAPNRGELSGQFVNVLNLGRDQH